MKKLSIFIVYSWLSISSAFAINFDGEISSISTEVISFDDQHFLLSPTVKVFNVNQKKIDIKTLKKGDIVSLELIKIGSKNLVDVITVQPLFIEENQNEK